ncbi:cytochrome c [Chryseolinea sp. H1M3-3]|uniref:c-type cytochrome n=1 Tax=Chryseolinea sp. H1M3-3 TaxID=3034144 RepID=UPI0023EBC3B9|nr:cytochrome c [Chryseolinea sp. H1M3-3]
MKRSEAFRQPCTYEGSCIRNSKRITYGSLFIVCVLCLGCTSNSSNENTPKFEQYFIQGKQLYLSHCSNCHQENGKGLGLLYPPLDTSDYMQSQMENVLCLIRNGKKGELIVNGKKFNQPMPGISTLSDLEVAEIATYIYNSWSHQHGLIDVKFASEILSRCDSIENSQ